MEKLQITIDDRMEARFASYPSHILPKMEYLRDLIFECAEELPGVSHLEETLKWGEPSYLAKKGSTIRMDWKEKTPDQYAIYFKCTSKLVPTFRNLFGDLFKYENNRAILFAVDDVIPEKEVKTCIKLALDYHKLKHLPNLGAS